jgi:hypothetical protein
MRDSKCNGLITTIKPELECEEITSRCNFSITASFFH